MDDYTMTVEQAQARADELSPPASGAWDDFATDTLVAIANGSEPAGEIAHAALSAHPRVFRYSHGLLARKRPPYLSDAEFDVYRALKQQVDAYRTNTAGDPEAVAVMLRSLADELSDPERRTSGE